MVKSPSAGAAKANSPAGVGGGAALLSSESAGSGQSTPETAALSVTEHGTEGGGEDNDGEKVHNHPIHENTHSKKPSHLRVQTTARTTTTTTTTATGDGVAHRTPRKEEDAGEDDPSPASLYNKLDKLELRWSASSLRTRRHHHHRHHHREQLQSPPAATAGYSNCLHDDFLDDGSTSLLSMGSFSSFRATSNPLGNGRGGNVVSSTPGQLLDAPGDTGAGRRRRRHPQAHGHHRDEQRVDSDDGANSQYRYNSSGSVFDRLYNDAKVRRRHSASRRSSPQEGGGGSPPSVSSSIVSTPTATTAASRRTSGGGDGDSVFDRLYRNEKRKSVSRRQNRQLQRRQQQWHQPHYHPSDTAVEDSAHARAAAALERRLSYRSGMRTLHIQHERQQRPATPTWSERLYRNERRPREELIEPATLPGRRQSKSPPDGALPETLRLQPSLEDNEEETGCTATKPEHQQQRVVVPVGSVLLIQRKWRGSKTRQSFVAARSSAMNIQRYFRRSRSNRHRLRQHRQRLMSAIKVQRIWRGFRSRAGTLEDTDGFAKFDDHADAAVTIQAWWRCSVVRTDFLIMRYCAVALQARIRCFLLRKAFVERELDRTATATSSEMTAATRIQAWWRMSVTSSGYLVLRYCAISIQSRVRGNLQRVVFCRDRKIASGKMSIHPVRSTDGFAPSRDSVYITRSGDAGEAACRIQSWWRMAVASAGYQYLRLSAIVLQTWWRMAMIREKYLCYMLYAVTLQSLWRGYYFRKRRFDGAVRIQSWWRSALLREQYLIVLVSAVTIQSVRRGYCQRIAFRDTLLASHRLVMCRNAAATTIQSEWRAALERTKYMRYQGAAQLIQSVFRGKLERMKYCAAYEAIVQIQAASQGYAIRRHLKLHVASATKIQSAYRMSKSRSQFMRSLGAIQLLQASVRGAQQRLKYHMTGQCIVKIQTVFRCLQARQKLLILRKERLLATTAATRIQSLWRMALARHRYPVRMASILMMQSAMRGKLSRSRYTAGRWSVVKLQSSFRRNIARRQFSRTVCAVICMQRLVRKFLAQHSSATFLQKLWRGSLARHRYVRYRGAAVIVQASMRGALVRIEFSSLLSSTIRLQRFLRTQIARRRLLDLLDHRQLAAASATKIQSTCRKYRARTYFALCISSITKIQSTIRMAQRRRELAHAFAAATTLQSIIRRNLARKSYLMHESSRISAATFLQKYWRGSLARHQYVKFRGAAVIIQSTMRGALIRTEYASLLSVIVFIQTFVRCYLSRQILAQLRLERNAALLIQKTWRGALAQSRFSRSLGATIIIQATIRGTLTRRTFLYYRRAATVLQSVCRKYSTRTQYIESRKKVSAAVCIQKLWRGWKARCTYNRWRSSTILLQAMARREHERDRFFRSRAAAETIKSLFQKHLARRELARLRDDRYASFSAAIILQRHWRCSLARMHCSRVRVSAVVIQSSIRRFRFRRSYLAVCDAVLMIQSHTRRLLARRELRLLQRKRLIAIREMEQERCTVAAMKIQAITRGFYSRARFHLAIKDAESLRRTHSSVSIQRFFRGHRCRVSIPHEFGFVAGQHRLRHTPVVSKSKAPSGVTPPEGTPVPASEAETPIRSPVAVKVLRRLSDHSVRIELCPLAFTERDGAARMLQSFVRTVHKQRKQRRVVRQQLVAELVAIRAEKAARSVTERILKGEEHVSSLRGICVARAAHHALEARRLLYNTSIVTAPELPGIRERGTPKKAPSVNKYFKEVFSPIAEVEDGWDWDS